MTTKEWEPCADCLNRYRFKKKAVSEALIARDANEGNRLFNEIFCKSCAEGVRKEIAKVRAKINANQGID